MCILRTSEPKLDYSGMIVRIRTKLLRVFFIARRHAVHAERDTVLAIRPPVRTMRVLEYSTQCSATFYDLVGASV